LQKNKLVILPAFNEGRFISHILDNLKSNTDADVIVIDDGSTDDTYLKLKEIRDIFVIRHIKNMGYGFSLIKGFNYAIEHGYNRIVTMDCDAQHEPDMVEVFFKEINDTDIVSGSRYLKDSRIISGAPMQRIRINRIITGIINEVTNYNITDVFCGFKGYKTESIKKLNLSVEGYGMPLQLWIQASNKNLTVKEIPVPVIYHTRNNFSGRLALGSERLKYYKQIIKEEIAKDKGFKLLKR
jgi:dolichol-phosphate mannosyltransferase